MANTPASAIWDPRWSPARLLAAPLLIALFSLPVELGSENLVLSAFYPSPLGIYANLTTTNQTVLARDGGAVAIGTSSPDPSAALDVRSTGGGLLAPRMDTTARDHISRPADGLLIYNISTHQFEYRNSAIPAWSPLGGGGKIRQSDFQRIFGGATAGGGSVTIDADMNLVNNGASAASGGTSSNPGSCNIASGACYYPFSTSAGDFYMHVILTATGVLFEDNNLSLPHSTDGPYLVPWD